MASLRQIAQVAEVSRATASLVLNRSKGWERISPQCTERVRAVADRLGYRVNYHMQSIRRGRANIIGFVVSVGVERNRNWRLGNDWWHALSAGAEGASHDREFDLLTIRPNESNSAIERGMSALREGKIDAIVAPHLPARDVVADAPIVVIGSDLTVPSSVVGFDEMAGVRLALDHLRELGHSQLLWFGPESDASGAPLRERLFISGVWDLSMRGVSLRTTPVYPGKAFENQDAWLVELERHARHFLAAGPREFSAVVAYNDFYAAAICRALIRSGVDVPGEVSVVGFDNLNAALAYPPLTTVDFRLDDVGYRAGQLAMDMAMAKEDRKRISQIKEIIAPHLCIRQSTARFEKSQTR